MTAQPRIVSLLASATELVCALGYQNRLVGRSHECDYPPEVLDLPQVSSPKFRAEGSSREIDLKLRKILEEGLGVYRVDVAKLEALRPTHIVTQDHCRVCAVSFADLENAAGALISSKPKILSVHPSSIGDIWRGFVEVAEGLGGRSRGEELVARLQARMASIETKAASESAPVVAHVEWLDPLMCGGNWMPELIRMAGGRAAFGVHGGKSLKTAWGEIVANDPDILLVCPCGFTIERTRSEMGLLVTKPEWQEMKAVRTARVYIADGNQYFNRPGPRIAESLEILAEMIHPQVFSFGHEGRGWVRFS